jgi:hypothetical protein
VPGFAEIAKPLTELTRKDQPFIWGNERKAMYDPCFSLSKF